MNISFLGTKVVIICQLGNLLIGGMGRLGGLGQVRRVGQVGRVGHDRGRAERAFVRCLFFANFSLILRSSFAQRSVRGEECDDKIRIIIRNSKKFCTFAASLMKVISERLSEIQKVIFDVKNNLLKLLIINY